MECIEARALKSSFVSEIGKISSQQVCFDDVRCLGSVTCDDFWVDDLFDFSDKCFEDGDCFQESEGENEARDDLFSSSIELQQGGSFDSDTLCNEENQFASIQEGQLPVPVDDMENLEWLSQIVDDSRTEISVLCPVGSFKGKTGSLLENRFEPVMRPAVHRIREPCFPLPVLRKPRGKRSRPNGRRVVWTFGSPSLPPESSSTTSYSSYGSSTISPVFGVVNQVEDSELFSSVEKPPSKKQKKKQAGENISVSGGSPTFRRCSHCLVQKTPQWRTGPLGPKTLCNACGVRYKSGRLFPEYRPVCSPTFSREIHSNSHRKVLEMRRMKEEGAAIETKCPIPAVPSF